MKNLTVIVLLVILIVALIIAAAVAWLQSSAEPSETTVEPTVSHPQSLDVEFFTTPEYQSLDRTTIERGDLPVAIPANSGKSNPFQ